MRNQCGKVVGHEPHTWVGVIAERAGMPRPVYTCFGNFPPFGSTPPPVETVRLADSPSQSCDYRRRFGNGLLSCAREVGHTGYHMADNLITWENTVPLREETPDNTPKVDRPSPVVVREREAKASAHEFWMTTANEDFEKCWAKAVRRSAVDLVALGSMFGAKTEKQRIQWGIAFYACGKAARIAGRIQSGEEPNPDDVLDLRVYSFMFAYVERFGGWPWPTS